MGYLMQAGRFDRKANLPRVTTGPDGRFTFTPPKGEFLLIAVSDAGYADATPDEFAKSGKLVLQPWGKIEGEVRIGSQPGAEPGGLVPARLLASRETELTTSPTATTPRPTSSAGSRSTGWSPAPGWCREGSPNPVDRLGIPAWGWQTPVEVKPGQTARVRIGGKGRPVIGRVVLDGKPETPVDWTKNQPVVIHVRRDEPPVRLGSRQGRPVPHRGRPARPVCAATPRGRASRSAVRTRRGPDRPGEMDLIVPEAPASRPDEPLDLGTITAKLFETLKVGEPAPDFDVERIAGKGQGRSAQAQRLAGQARPARFLGRVCDPSLAELLALKDIQKTFGGDPRFRLISLSCDPDRRASPARHQGERADLDARIRRHAERRLGPRVSYKLRSIPATFLIGTGWPHPGEGPAWSRAEGGDRHGPQVRGRWQGEAEMNVFSIVLDAVAHLANGSTGPVLIAKWTLLLVLVWLAHAALAGRNPRWRVALWRGAMLGVAIIMVLAMVPPIVSVLIVTDGPRRIVERAVQPGAALRVEPAPPAVVVSPPEPSSTMQRIAIAPVARAEHSPDLATRSRPSGPGPPAESWPSRAIGLAQ